jgi:peptidyl-prolyl cis-trans isomerase C
MRRLSLSAAAILLCTTGLSVAQAPAPRSSPAQAAASAKPVGDPVVARVGTDEIHASELSEAAQALPEELRGMPPTSLYPILLDQLVDRQVVVIAARKQGLERDPSVQRMVARATDSALQNALLTREIAPTLTDDAIRARYERDIAGKSGEPEIRARHILVADEETANKVIAELKGGADFAELAKKYSTDPGAQSGGDLGFFKKGDMLPEFSDAAFALKPGETTPTPVKTRFGWHVIQVEEVRTAPPPAYEQVRDEIRQSLIQEGVTRVLATAKTGLPIEKFNPDGSPMAPASAPAAPAPTAPPAK